MWFKILLPFCAKLTNLLIMNIIFVFKNLFKRRRINCSKFISSKKLLDTVRADVKKMKTARKSKKHHFEQMQVLDQNEQLLELQLLD